MPSDVAYPVDTGQTFPVVSLSGLLDADAVPAVRAAILDVLATQPEALVIDLAAARIADHAMPGEVAGLVRETTEWPAARVVLSTPHDRALWAAAGLRVCADLAAAFAELGPPHPAFQRRLDLEPLVGAARRARELVTEACAQWECPDLCGPACIVVTEMVNNVVAHAHTDMTVLLAWLGDTISVAVRDSSATIPRFTGPVSPTAYGGRGLLLIDSVSDRWGSLRLSTGKVVWSRLAVDDEAEPSERPVSEAGIPGPARG